MGCPARPVRPYFSRAHFFRHFWADFDLGTCFLFGKMIEIQSLEYETEKTVLFWDILWHKNFVGMNCETNLASEYAPKPPWPTGFEKSKIPQPNPEILQFKGSKIWAFLLVFQHFPLESCQIAWILLPSNCNFSRLGWLIFDFSKAVGQEDLGAYSEGKCGI